MVEKTWRKGTLLWPSGMRMVRITTGRHMGLFYEKKIDPAEPCHTVFKENQDF